MRFRNSLFFLYFAALSAIVAGAEREQEEAIDPADLVYLGITDLTTLRDTVLKRYALMVTGETVRFIDSRLDGVPLQIDRNYRLQAVNKAKSFRYLARGNVVGTDRSNRPYEYQSWTEFYQCGLQLRGRSGSAIVHGYKLREKGQSIPAFVEEHRLKGVRFDPFDDLVLHPMFFGNHAEQYGWIEQVFLRESELLSAELITQDDLLSRWRWKHHTLDFEIELTQSKAYDYLPVKVRYTSKIPKMSTLFGETDIRWKKHEKSGHLLPFIVRTAEGAPFGDGQVQHAWKFDWRNDEEIPDDFFDCESEDFRLKFSPLYDFYFDTYAQPGGRLTGTPWTTPEELLPEKTETRGAK